MKVPYNEVLDWMGPEGAAPASELKSNQYRSRVGVEDPISLQKSDLQQWRLHVIDLAHKIIPGGMSGNCVEIGAGRGIAAARVSAYESVECSYALDYAAGAVYDAMPATQPCVAGVNLNKLRRVLGSFDGLPTSKMDRVLAFGALHNAPDLKIAFQSISKTLTDDGWVICSDLALHPGTPASVSTEMSNAEVPNSKARFGTEGIRFIDTSDHFRTPIDYIAAAKQAGFFVYTFIYDHRTLNLLRRPSLAVSRRDFGLKCYYPWGATGRYDRLLLLGTKKPPVQPFDPSGRTQVSRLHQGPALLLQSATSWLAKVTGRQKSTSNQ